MKLKALVSLTYPSPDTLAIVKKAGGMTKLTPEQRSKVKMINKKAGQFCDDIPETSLKWLLNQKLVEQVDGSKVVKKKTVKGRGK